MLGRDLPAHHPYVAAGVPMHGPNLWPAGLPGLRPQQRAWEAEMIHLGRHLMACIAVSLDLPADHFAASNAGAASACCAIRRNPPQSGDAGGNRLGAGAHADRGSITILLQDELGGLEVRNAGGDWIRATPIPGSFVVNIGRMMERFTACLYRASLHRVRNGDTGRARHSVATFFELDHFHRPGRAPACPPDPACEAPGDLGGGEHIGQMARAGHGR